MLPNQGLDVVSLTWRQREDFGLSLEGIGMVLAVDRILDMCRTVVNVTGDAAVAYVVAATEGLLNEPNLDD